MTELTLHDYKPEHFLSIDGHERFVPDPTEQRVRELADYHHLHGPATTVMDPGGQIVLCAGIHGAWTGTGEVWALFSPLAKVYLQTTFWVRHFLVHAQETLGYNRLQAAIRLDCPIDVRFIERLGFEREGVMRHYVDGADYALYALVREA